MRTIITLAIVVAVINAAGRAGTAYWKYYQFKDAAQQLVTFGGLTPTTTLHEQVLDKAGKLEIPISPDDVTVERNDTRTVIDASYVQPVEFFPRYQYPISFRFSVEGTYSGGLGTPSANPK